MKVHVLDANALYRFLIGGPGSDLVSRLFQQARDEEQPLKMSVVNWGEVYYTIARVKGFSETSGIMDRVKLLPLAILDADESVTTRAAKLKAGQGLPYADCFAAAIAEPGDIIVTAAAKDFRKIQGIQVLSLPPHKA